MSDAGEERLREALAEVERYLCDATAPLLVADDVVVAAGDPRRLAGECASWASEQFRVLEAEVPYSDLLFHAVKKLHLLGELELIPRAALAPVVEQVKAYLVQICPESEREVLRDNFRHLGSGKTVLTQAVGYLERIAEEAAPAGRASRVRGLPGAPRETDQVAGEVVRGLRRFELLLERLGPLAAAAGETGAAASPGAPPPRGTGAATAGKGDGAAAANGRAPVAGDGRHAAAGAIPTASGERARLVAEIIANLVEAAQSEGDLQRLLDRAAAAGLGRLPPEEMMRVLGDNLPDWALTEGGEAALGSSAQAMERLVTLPEDPRKTADRLWGLVRAGIEQLNQGAIGRAVAIFEVAGKLIREEKVPAAQVERIQGSAHEFLDSDRLRELAADPARRRPLRRVLAFFPRLQAAALLDELAVCEDRQQRRLILSLLEVHGAEARSAVVAALARSIDTSEQATGTWQVQRNLLYLLRRIPAPPTPLMAEEVDLITSLTGLEREPSLLREVLGYLGQSGDERAVPLLVQRVREIEGRLEAERDPSSLAEQRKLLAAATAALARTGSPAAYGEVVRVGLPRRRGFGTPGERLADLGAADLASAPEVVAQLLETLRRALPVRILGLTVHRDTALAGYVIQALSRTSSPAVREALADVAGRFADEELGEMATAVLEQAPLPGTAAEVSDLDATADRASSAPLQPPASEGIEGEVDLFGLPTLLQSLAYARRSGELRIVGQEGTAIADLHLDDGQLVGCRHGGLGGDAAIYGLLQEPPRGTFTFRPLPPSPAKGTTRRDLVPMLVEGMRRHDELRRARTLLPPGQALTATGLSPSTPEGEEGAFLHEVWRRVKKGELPGEIAAALPVDPFRVWRLLVRWLEEDALRPAGEESMG